MRIAELWRYPVKSMRGEQLYDTVLTDDGVPGDRVAHVYGPRGVSPRGPGTGCSGWPAPWAPTVSR